jgi:hypothetical protein
LPFGEVTVALPQFIGALLSRLRPLRRRHRLV